ncbi:MAG: thiol-disulfide oxidoreductase DCC family protein [Candidatus Omnitrophota bacterium]
MNVTDRDQKTRPVMLYDGDCAVCRRWIRRWQGLTGKRVEYQPYQQTIGRYPQLSREQCAHAVQLIRPDGTVVSGARAVLESLSSAGRWRWLLWMYERVPLFGRVCEWVYRLIARHRPLLSRLS